MLLKIVLTLSILLPGIICYRRFGYSDCNIGSTNVIRISSVSVSPYPIEIPGRLTVATDFQVFRNLTEGMRLGVRIMRTVSLWGYYETLIEIPCYSNVGSCEYELCDLLDIFKVNGVFNCPRQLVSSNIPCTCPIAAGTYTLRSSQFHIPTASGFWSWLVVGDYQLRYTLTNTTNNERIGCYDFSITIDNPSCTGFMCSLIK